jgi:medium-chain acyl-[acyl-carrier-protein] hydrolase
MSVSAPSNPWLFVPRRLEQPRLRLLCFPCAGGGASSYGEWAAHVPEGVELVAVRLPGRDSRAREKAITELPVLVEALVDVLCPLLNQPVVFFGHSTGALVAFELSRRLRMLGVMAPTGLIVACCRAPHLPLQHSPIHQLPRDEFVAELRRFGGTPEAVLAHPEFLEMIIPSLRADLGLLERYQHEADSPLACAIVGCAGADDPHVRLDEVEAWGSHTAAAFTAHSFAGDHFFFRGRVPELLRVLRPHLETWRGT